MPNIFKNLLLLGRPASGKSEFIDFMKNVPDNERARRFHIGPFKEVDDFLWIWEKFVEDDLWEKVGQPRLYSKHYMPGNPGMMPGGERLFQFCMYKFNEVITKKYLVTHAPPPPPSPSRGEGEGGGDFYKDHTLFIEFSRGRKDAYKNALNALRPEVLEKAAILFIHTSREESWRRNVARYQEKLKHSILAHMVPKETFDYFYSEHDWEGLTGGRESGYLGVRSHPECHSRESGNPECTNEIPAFAGMTAAKGSDPIRVPFVTMNNEPESVEPEILEPRYKSALDKLWELNEKRI